MSKKIDEIVKWANDLKYYRDKLDSVNFFLSNSQLEVKFETNKPQYGEKTVEYLCQSTNALKTLLEHEKNMYFTFIEDLEKSIENEIAPQKYNPVED